MLSEEKFLYLCCLELIITYCQYTEKKEEKKKCLKKQNKSRLLVLSFLVSSPVTTIHSAALQTNDLFFLLLTSQACPSPLFSLPSFSLKVTFFLLCASGLQCLGLLLSAFSASVQDMRGRALKHSPFFPELGRKEGRRSRRGVVTCMGYHLTPSFAEDNSPTPWVTRRYWLQRQKPKFDKIVISHIHTTYSILRKHVITALLVNHYLSSISFRLYVSQKMRKEMMDKMICQWLVRIPGNDEGPHPEHPCLTQKREQLIAP